MSEEELEKTGILKDLLNKEDEEEMTINEMIEEFLVPAGNTFVD